MSTRPPSPRRSTFWPFGRRPAKAKAPNAPTASSIFSDALSALHRGEKDEAWRLLRKSAERAMRSVPPEPQTAISSLATLAAIYLGQHEVSAARTVYEEMSGIVKAHRLWGTASQVELLRIWARLCVARGARADAIEALEQGRRILNSPGTVSARSTALGLASNLANLYVLDDRAELAIQILQDALAHSATIPLPQDPEQQTNLRISIANVQTSLSDAYAKADKYREAAEAASHALAIEESVFGPNRRETGMAHLRLGNARFELGDTTSAEIHFKHACEVLRALQTRVPLHEGRALNMLGMIALRGRRLSEAQRLFEESLEVARKFRTDDASIAVAMNNIAVALREQGKLAEAEPLQLEALRVHQKTLDAEHPLLANTMKNLAILRHRQGRADEAIAIGSDALQIVERRLGLDHPKTREIRAHLESFGTPS